MHTTQLIHEGMQTKVRLHSYLYEWIDTMQFRHSTSLETTPVSTTTESRTRTIEIPKYRFGFPSQFDPQHM